jgi:hypothetical protein
MDLNPYLDSVRQGVAQAAALADEHTQGVAHRLGSAIESSTRLALIQALSDAAGAISAELAPTSVDLRMTGHDPEFVVNVAPPGEQPMLLVPAAEAPVGTEREGTGAGDADAGDDEESVARISLRLPSSVKQRVDEMADRDGISTNAWLIRAVVDALPDSRRGDRPRPPQPPPSPPGGGVFGPHGPFGAHGIFGSGGPFASGRSGRGRDSEPSSDAGPSSGGVQGWVR